MKKQHYLFLLFGFLAISFIAYINQNKLIILVDKIFSKSIVTKDSTQPITKEDLLGKYKTMVKSRYTMLDIYKDSFTMSFYRHFATEAYSGKWSYENNSLHLSYLYTGEYDTSYIVNRRYQFMRQDSFLFCVPYYDEQELRQEYIKICNLYNNGANFNEEYGETYIMRKKLHNYLPISIPTIPAEYHNYLLKQPINCQITAIENDTILTINAGKENGIFEGLQLHKKVEFEKEKKQKRKKRGNYQEENENNNPLFMTFEVVRCENNLAVLKFVETWEFSHATALKMKKLQIGDTLYSKKSKI